MGHFRETLMAVCSTPSSPLRVVLPEEAATLLKFRLTVGREAQAVEEGQVAGGSAHTPEHALAPPALHTGEWSSFFQGSCGPALRKSSL